MGNKPVLILIVLLALGAVFWLMGGAALFDPGVESGEGEDVASGGSALDHVAGQGAGGSAGQGQASQGPVLFGRARAERAGKGALMGRVMDFRSGKPIAGATVVVSGRGYGEETFAEQGTTDAQGHFELTDLPAGERYGLHVSTASTLQRTLSSVSVDAEGLRDLGTIWLGERGTLKGVVLDEGGAPVAAAQVQVHRGGGSMMEMLRDFSKLFEEIDKDAVPLLTVQSSATGRFEAAGIDPGPITLVVRAPGFQQKMLGAVMTADGAAGGELKIRLTAGTPLAGVVVDQQGRGVAGARVAFLDEGDTDSAFFGRLFTLTDAAGRFRVDSPPTRGSFIAMVVVAGFPTLMTKVEGAPDELRLVLRGGIDVIVRVLEKGTERPVEGARLTVMFGEDDSYSGKNMSMSNASTDFRGEAHLAAPEGKLMMLLLNHAERGRGMFSPMMAGLGSMGVLQGPKDTTIKKPRTTLVFHLQQGLTITGQVTDTAGSPIAGARCSALGAMGLGTTATTDEEGHYTLVGQSAPVRAVIVTAPGYVPEEPPTGQGLTAARSGEDMTLDIRMMRAASISGRVFDPNGKPLAGVRVKHGGGAMASLAALTGARVEGISNAEGRYVLDGVQPGKGGRVLGRLAGYLDVQSKAFEVTSGEVNVAPDLRLKLGSSVTLKVREPDGSRASGARVEVNVQAQDTVNWDVYNSFRSFADQKTTASGETEIRDLPDGKVTLTATKKGFAAGRVVVETKRGEAAGQHDLVVLLREANSLRGRVIDMDGQPVAEAIVQCNSPGAQGEGGGFEIDDLPDQPMLLFVTGKGLKAARQSVAGARGFVELRVKRMDAGVANRLEAIQKELMGIYQQYGAVKDDAERQSLLKRMQALQAEQRELQGAGNAATEYVPVEDGE